MPRPGEYVAELFALDGKVAVIIGGTGELCGAMGEGLAAAGAEVVLVGRNQDKARPRLERIAAAGGKSWFWAADATDKAGLEALRDEVVRRCGRINVVINGAGINSATPFFDITLEEFNRIVDLNFKGVFLSCQVLGKYLVERGDGGSIINLGSMAGLTPLSRVFTYSASKAAVHNLTRNLAREWAPFRVRVNTLVPGFFPAEQNRQVLTPDRVSSILGHTPMNRFGQARELIGATLLLASDVAGAFMTGAEIVVDGGFSAMTI